MDGLLDYLRILEDIEHLWGLSSLLILPLLTPLFDVELMTVTLKFWSKSINFFLLHFGLISIRWRDVAIFTGLPIRGADVLCLLDV